jgi:hypothetical protein
MIRISKTVKLKLLLLLLILSGIGRSVTVAQTYPGEVTLLTDSNLSGAAGSIRYGSFVVPNGIHTIRVVLTIRSGYVTSKIESNNATPNPDIPGTTYYYSPAPGEIIAPWAPSTTYGIAIKGQTNYSGLSVKVTGLPDYVDFNGDRKSDLIWRHDSGAICAWFMNGTNYSSGTFLNPGSTDPSWKVCATGDFDGDGKVDLVWRHTSGAIYFWFMDGINFKSGSFGNPNQADPSWKIVGVEDFNQDGKPDLVWRHDSGAICVWFMNGVNILSSSFFNPSSTDPSWKIVCVQDFNQDAKPDLVLRHDSGALCVWFMNGINILSSSFFNPAQLDPSWKSPSP